MTSEKKLIFVGIISTVKPSNKEQKIFFEINRN